MKPDCPTDNQCVIPAKAGIQLIELGFAGMGGFLPNSQKFSRNGSVPGLCPLRGVLLSLDFRLRGNDGSIG